MQESPPNDVNVSVLGAGCATSCVGGCLSGVVLGAIAMAMGVQAIRQGSGLPFLGFLAGLVIHLAVGYFTGKAAREHKVAVNFHVIIVGVISMIIGLISFVTPERTGILSTQAKALTQALGIISWMLTIPLMLWGASWSDDDYSQAP